MKHAVTAALLAGALVPLAAIGDLDPDFGEHGLLSLQIGQFGASALAIVQQPDGKLVLAGVAGHDFVIVRLLDGGTADPAFGANGIASADFFGSDDVAQAVLRQADGMLVLAGIAATSDGSTDMAVARFNADGTLDATFGEAGKTTVDSRGGREFAQCMVQQPDGKFVIAGGTTDSTGTTEMVLARLNSDGSVDASFGAGGLALPALPGVSSAWINDVELQADGKLLIVGSIRSAENWDVGVARLLPNGELDSSFGVGGMLRIDIAAGYEEGRSLALEPGTGIVIAGYHRPAGSPTSDALLVRLDADGGFDNGFGLSGVAISGLGGDSVLNALALEPGGAIVAAGSLTTDIAGPDTILARFNSDGSIDPSFGNAGIEIVDYGSGADATISDGIGLIRQSDGKHVVVGPSSMGRFSAARVDGTATFAGRIGLTETFLRVSETASEVSYSVRRTGGDAGEVSVRFATTGGDAEADADFADSTGTLTWLDGDASDRTITIRILNDAEVEPDESFALFISAPANGAYLAASEASTTIASDDGPGRIGFWFALDVFRPIEAAAAISVPVRRSAGSQGEVSVRYSTASGTATSGSDFEPATGTLTWADGEAGVKWIQIQILQDSIAENRENFVVCLGDSTGGATIETFGNIQVVVIVDDDGPDGGGSGGGSLSCGSPGGGGGGGDGGGSGGGGAFGWLILLGLCLLRVLQCRTVSRGSARSS